MAYMTHNKHHKSGDGAPPPVQPDVYRVYGMKHCPFVQRSKLIMHACNFDHETININTLDKPDWFYEKNSHGKVPVLEYNGNILNESDVIMRYVIGATGKENELFTQDPMRRAKEELLIIDLNQAIVGWFTHGKAETDEKREEAKKIIVDSFTKLEGFLKNYNSNYVGGDRPRFNDFMFWPILQRLAIGHRALLDGNPTVREYHARMLTNESVKACKHPDEVDKEFYEAYFRGDASKYDKI